MPTGCDHQRIALGLPIRWDLRGFYRPAVCLVCGERFEVMPAGDGDAEFQSVEHDSEVQAKIAQPEVGE